MKYKTDKSPRQNLEEEILTSFLEQAKGLGKPIVVFKEEASYWQMREQALSQKKYHILLDQKEKISDLQAILYHVLEEGDRRGRKLAVKYCELYGHELLGL